METNDAPDLRAATLKGERVKLGLSLRDVEQITKGRISNAYLSQLENGKIRNPSIGVCCELAAAYGTTVERIMDMLGQRARPPSMPTCPTCGQSLFNAALSRNEEAGEAIPCGGCGETESRKRCIGCMHDFGTPESAWVRAYATPPSDHIASPSGEDDAILASTNGVTFADICEHYQETGEIEIGRLPGNATPSPAQQSGELREAVRRQVIAIHKQYGMYGYDIDRCDIATDEILSLLASTTPPQSREGSLFEVLRDQSWDLRCFDMPTGGGDADIGWRVIGHWMAKPHERVIAEVYFNDPAAAVRAALASTEAPVSSPVVGEK